ncbi:MAG: alpha/beta fold hydrolase [Dongiaceae bacterium]
MSSNPRRNPLSSQPEPAPSPTKPGLTKIDQAGWAGTKQRATLPNGITIAYADKGNPEGRPVLLVHGYTDSSRSWSLPMAHLAHRYRLIAVDLRGHGASSAPECCYTVPDMVHDLCLLLDHLRIEKVDFVGHSLGSMIGQVFAQRHADRLRKLVLVGSTLSAAKATAPGSWLSGNVRALTDPVDENSAFITEWTTNPTPVDAEFIAHARREACAIPTRIWRAVLQELHTAEYGRLSSTITAPTMILWGGQDPLFSAEDQQALREAIKDSEFVAFNKLGHNLQWEDPAGVAALIAHFLN